MLSINQAATLLGGKAKGNRICCPGPGHSKYDTSLWVTFRPDGTFTTKSFAEDDWRDCRDHVKNRLGLSDARPIPVYVRPVRVTAGSEHALTGSVLRMWDSSIPIAGTLAESYLSSRGLVYDGAALRFRPGCRSLVALITDAITGQPCGAQRTFLDVAGRAIRTPEGKKLNKIYGRASGGVVRLYEHEAPFGLAIAEGIETALAAYFQPIWACLSSSIMQGFPVLPGIECLTVFADHDKAGIAAANAVGQRWHDAGREVTLTMPAIPGTDFADRRAA